MKKVKKQVAWLLVLSVSIAVLLVTGGFFALFSGRPPELLHALAFAAPVLILVLAADLAAYYKITAVVEHELNHAAESIKEQKRRQKEVDKIKRQFTANVSHELKTPLTSIAGYAELIENGMAEEADVKRFAATIHSEAQRLINLSSDIIKLSQLDEAEGTPQLTAVDLYECAENCINALTLKAEKRKVSLRLLGDSCVIQANRALIEDLIYNLCENAIRYNKENGTVTVNVGFDGTYSILRVSDTGIGIPAKYQKRIFERFYRVDKSRSKETGGTGLGLAIVKHIAEFHRAALSLESKENEGTIITVRFPEK